MIGKTVLVTGSTDGIGRQTAVELAAGARRETKPVAARLERESQARHWGILEGLARGVSGAATGIVGVTSLSAMRRGCMP